MDLHALTVAQTTDFFYPLVDDPYIQVGADADHGVSHDITIHRA